MLPRKTPRLAGVAQAEVIHARGQPCAITYERTDGNLQALHARYSGQNSYFTDFRSPQTGQYGYAMLSVAWCRIMSS